MDQHQVLRDATSPVLRLLRRLCAAVPGPGGAWKDEFIVFLWRVWSWLQACKNRNGAAPAPVADPRPLVGDDDDGYYTKVTEEDDDDFGKKERAIDIELTKNTNADLAGRAALRIDSMGKNADLAGPAALGIDFMGKNADLAGPAALGIDSKDENADLAGPSALGIDSKDTSTDLAGAADLDINSIGKKADLAGAAALGIDSKGENADLAGPSALGMDFMGRNADLAGQAALGVDDDDGGSSIKNRVTDHHHDGGSSIKNRVIDPDDVPSELLQDADLAGPAALGILSKDKNAGKECSLGTFKNTMIAVQKPPALAPWGSAPAGRAPARAVEEEEEERRAIHLKYVEVCSSLKGKRTYCFSCFMENEIDPAKKGKEPAKIEKNKNEAIKHMDARHKSNSTPIKCSKSGCFAMSRIRQDIGHHEKYAHGL